MPRSAAGLALLSQATSPAHLQAHQGSEHVELVPDCAGLEPSLPLPGRSKPVELEGRETDVFTRAVHTS